jgi:hypothetical protein
MMIAGAYRAGEPCQPGTMSEQEIFWVGRRPGVTGQAAAAGPDPAFRAALATVCEGAGWPVNRFVAARGEHGSWLVEMRGAQPRRLIWNGQAGRLSLDEANPAGGWTERRGRNVTAPGADELLAAAAALLDES